MSGCSAVPVRVEIRGGIAVARMRNSARTLENSAILEVHEMSTPAQRFIWLANEAMALRPNLPRVMALESSELRELVDRELSDQQKRVIFLLSEGYANKHIAWVLGVEEATAKAHVSAVLKKLGCTNRTQAALLGQRIRAEVAISSAAASSMSAGSQNVSIDVA